MGDSSFVDEYALTLACLTQPDLIADPTSEDLSEEELREVRRVVSAELKALAEDYAVHFTILFKHLAKPSKTQVEALKKQFPELIVLESSATEESPEHHRSLNDLKRIRDYFDHNKG
ncbi:MAG: hypothetical protein R3C18_23405 [Planctomycetaceae bacterium]